MPLLVVVLVAAAAVGVLAWGGPRSGGPAGRWLRRGAVALVVTLPLLYAAALLLAAGDRMGALSVEYVGKQLAFAPELPVTVGGTDRDSGRSEDLHAARLPSDALTLRPAEGDGLLLELGSPAPAVEVDGTLRNSIELHQGDGVAVADPAGGPPALLTFEGDAVTAGGARVDLPAGWLLRLRGSDRVVFLRDLLTALAPASGARTLSFLRYADGAWHLVLREREVAVRRAGGEELGFEERLEVPSPVRVRLGVVLGAPGRWTLAWVRDDRLLRRDGVLEVELSRPWRYLAEVEPPGEAVVPSGEPRRLALVVPGTFDRREMIELDEPSPRFRGLVAGLDVPRDGAPTLHYLGASRALAFGEVYGLGEGEDLLFLRFARQDFPWPLLLDLALLALFLGVFLGPSLAAEAGLAAVVAPSGLLLANRLLFTWKAAARPPAYPVEALAEARLALWLVPALLLVGWSLAWALGRDPQGVGRAVRWPAGGLLLAAIGCALVGDGGDRLLALLPLAAALLLFALPKLLARPAVAARIARWRRDGISWRLTWLLLAGVAILLARALFAALGMPEALRLPGGARLLLWASIQVPLCVVLVGLSLVSARRRMAAAAAGRRAAIDGGEPAAAASGPAAPAPAAGLRARAAGALASMRAWTARHPGAAWPLAVLSLLVFLALAFAAVAALVDDLGLLLVQGLPFALALLLLVDWPRRLPALSRRGLTVACGLLLAVLPAAGVVIVNRLPEVAVRLLAGGGGEAGDEAAVPVRDRLAELSSQRAQQMFRLYMLANPSALRQVGLEPAERAAVQYETLQGYAGRAGWRGDGFLAAPLPRHLGATYLSDLVPMVFVLPELGLLGLLALALVYLLPLGWLAAAPPSRGPLAEQGTMLTAVAAVAFAVPGIYMILANLNLVLFSGKNAPLLGLNSLSDALETGLVLAVAAAGLGLRRSSR